MASDRDIKCSGTTLKEQKENIFRCCDDYSEAYLISQDKAQLGAAYEKDESINQINQIELSCISNESSAENNAMKHPKKKFFS